MIQFFMPMKPPTVTDQMHRVSIRREKPVFYDSQELKAAREKLTAHLARFAPAEPFSECAVRLTVKWCFPRGSHRDGEYKTSKPDTDNLQKMLKDCMTKTRFFKDDALVASEIVEKFWAEVPGIFVRIQTVSEGGEWM